MTKGETTMAVDCFTSTAGTSKKMHDARQWGRRHEMPCPFCRSRPTRGSWMQHIVAKHAPVGYGLNPWLTAFTFGEVESARNCTNGSVRRMEAA